MDTPTRSPRARRPWIRLAVPTTDTHGAVLLELYPWAVYLAAAADKGADGERGAIDAVARIERAIIEAGIGYHPLMRNSGPCGEGEVDGLRLTPVSP